MHSFMDDQAVTERILSHVSNGTTDTGEEVWREPVESYRSEEHFQRELALLRRLAVPFCPSAALREPGSYVAREAAGVPILAVRGEDGKVRAFRNACRHRGAEIASGTGNTKAFVCPYHGWTYQLDGRLQRVSHEHGFPGLDKDAHGLVPVKAEERSGIVFVTQSPQDDESSPGETLPELIAPSLDLIGTHGNVADVNWKISLEGSIEGYHIRFGHRDTFYPYGYDNLNVVEMSGRHSRVTYPFKRIEKLADLPQAERRVEGRLTYVYHLFPNALVTVLSRHTNLVVLEPVAVDQTRLVSYALADTGGDPAAMESAKRDAEFVNQTGAAEDLALVEGIQRSMESGANECFTFGHFESAIVHFHRNLHAEMKREE
ncbi:MAG: Rieske 2Fe-2S domain-containing protein [Halioglobus sp.]|nr:Rieske 2Fe-2S domain-containing protein [Halioglobus sp.]